jgi:hypothetical protein
MSERPERVLKPCGRLRKAIEEDYAAPDRYKTAEERAGEEVEAKRRAEEAQQSLEEQQQAKVAEQEQARQKETDELAGLHNALRYPTK